ncbi:hypothetical protein Bca52824_038495 [Brassica carinata]|uniref:Uncharacterized protein n=1 Tax=Brassica carinata TaxID=52824 RepID=A0A8X7UW15_BRACI|nr:hypothetical protein Bca52824_038495 [Brassica carinata]
MQEMMSPASNDALEVMETTKVKMPKFQGESNESCYRSGGRVMVSDGGDDKVESRGVVTTWL